MSAQTLVIGLFPTFTGHTQRLIIPDPAPFLVQGHERAPDQTEISARRSLLLTEAASFNRDVGKIFREAGIAPDPEPVLSQNHRGKILVSNDHSQKQQIETLLYAHPEIAFRLTALSAQAAFIEVADRYDEFARRYQTLSTAARRRLVREERRYNQSLVCQFAVGVEGPAIFFTVGELHWH